MTASTMEWYGTRFGRLGSSADIVVAFPLVDGDPDIAAHTDASRIGFYADRTGGSEKVGFVIMGTDAIALFDDRIEIAGNTVWDAANLVSPQETAEKGAINGYASLDGAGKVPLGELPASVIGGMSYQGTWNASTNSPVLASGVGTQGHYYVVSVAGSTNLDGITDWQIGDWVVYNGAAWEKIDNTDSFTVKADAADASPGFLDAKVDGVTVQVNGSDQLEVIPGGLTLNATQITVSAAGFSGVLSPADTDAQLAFATLDAHTHALDDLSDVILVSGVAIPNAISTLVDTASTGTAWKWLLVFNDGAGGYQAVEVLAAATGVATVDSTIYSGTAIYPHTITVARAASVTTLRVTASGVGYTASARRMTMP